MTGKILRPLPRLRARQFQSTTKPRLSMQASHWQRSTSLWIYLARHLLPEEVSASRPAHIATLRPKYSCVTNRKSVSVCFSVPPSSVGGRTDRSAGKHAGAFLLYKAQTTVVAGH